MSWLFSRALAEEYWADNCLDGEPCAALNVMETPRPFLRNGKTMDFSSLSRFGVTSARLTDDRGRELLTWFLVGFPAKTFQRPGKAPASKGGGRDSGRKWRGSLAKYDHDSRLWKTHQYSLLGGLDEFSATWPRWGSMRNGELYLLPTPSGLLEIRALINSESAFGLSQRMPTPLENDARKRGDFDSSNPRNGLPAAVKRFPTPTASDGSRGGVMTEGMTGQGLVQVVNTIERVSARRPSYRPSYRLNPDWTEWLMGWPIGWTSLEPLRELRVEGWGNEPLDVPRVAKGAPEWVARIRAIGNGQVPACVALAWQILTDTETIK